ncbi:hypothetical protein [Halogeometricum sp. CBA1124]|nr:hypothetical protein [Halogeometricum sp. CBA1124]MUV56090.1 hypothetical protein [Halogeometricum sp. CBA1124]
MFIEDFVNCSVAWYRTSIRSKVLQALLLGEDVVPFLDFLPIPVLDSGL